MYLEVFYDSQRLTIKNILDLNQQFLILRKRYGTIWQDSDNHWYNPGIVCMLIPGPIIMNSLSLIPGIPGPFWIYVCNHEEL